MYGVHRQNSDLLSVELLFWWPIVFFLRRPWSANVPRQVAILNEPGPRALFSWLSLFWSFIHSCILFFFFSLLNFFLFLFLLGQNAPASDPHSLPLVNKADGRCCFRTRPPSMCCMLICGQLKPPSFIID